VEEVDDQQEDRELGQGDEEVGQAQEGVVDGAPEPARHGPDGELGDEPR
jgi:hypothetical protein